MYVDGITNLHTGSVILSLFILSIEYHSYPTGDIVALGVYIFFYYAWISSLPYIIIVIFLFSHSKQRIVELTTISSLLASWFVVWQIAVSPLGLSAWRFLFFGARLTWYSHPILLRYLYHWNVRDIFIYCLIMVWKVICHISVVFVALSHWWQGIVELAAFSSVVIPSVIITTIRGAIGGGEVVGLMIFCFQCSISMISTHSFIVTLTSLKCTWYVVKLSYCARIISLQYFNRIIFSHWKQWSSLWRLCRRWWHRELSVRQIEVLPVTVGFVGLVTLVLSARLTWYWH